MELHQPQTVIASDTHRFRVAVIGRRFGKTTLDVEEIKGKGLVSRMRRINTLINLSQEEKQNIEIMHNIDDYQCRVDYFAPTYEDARDLVWAPLCRELAPVTIGQPNNTRLEIVIKNLDGGRSLIKLRSWENIDNFRGRKSDFAIFDEIRKYKNFWMNWREVIRPTLSDYIGEALFTTTPNGFDHVYDLFNLEATDDDFKSFHYTSYDNPYLARSEIEKAKKELPEDEFAQEYMADFRKRKGLVYKEFNRDKHVFDEPGFDGETFQVVKTIGGVDFGTTNPAAAIEIKVDKDNNYWVFEKLYKRGMTDSATADYVAALDWNECYPDPESASGVKELESRDVNVRPVIKGKDSVRNGISRVRELFKANRLFINREALSLIEELETYHYPEKRADKNEDEVPIKEDDHALDALRYPLMMDSPTHKKDDSVHVYKPKYKGYNQRG